MEYEEIVAPAAKPKKKVHGFSVLKEEQVVEIEAKVEVEDFAVVEEAQVETPAPVIKHHSELIRPLTPKRSVARRGIKGASTTRP